METLTTTKRKWLEKLAEVIVEMDACRRDHHDPAMTMEELVAEFEWSTAINKALDVTDAIRKRKGV